MEREQLLAAIKTTLQKTKVNELTKIAAENNFSIKLLIDLTFHENDQIAFRSAWILENIYERYLVRFLPQANYFLEKFPQQKNHSCLRHYCKILALMTQKKATSDVKKIIDVYDTNTLAEIVFAWLIDEKMPVAVKSHCLNILANLHTKHSWIKAELLETMDFLVDRESIAFYAKAKQIRKQLRE